MNIQTLPQNNSMQRVGQLSLIQLIANANTADEINAILKRIGQCKG